jgi:DNA repair exonuclease SbcCD ATPase subunit
MAMAQSQSANSLQRSNDFAQLQKEYRLMEMNRKVRFLCHSAEHSREGRMRCPLLRGCLCAACFHCEPARAHTVLRAAVSPPSLLSPPCALASSLDALQAFAEESHQVLRKQQGNLEKLRADNEALKTEMAMEMRASGRPANLAQQRKETLKLRDEIERYNDFIAQEKRTMQVTSEQVALMKQKILHTRKNMGGVNAARENQAMIQKQIRILENRLDKALVKFNEALAHNKKLRDQIDDLRRERVVFDSIYRKLDKELHDRKKMMANIIELSNLSYESRDNFQMEIAAIEQANRKEQEDFEEQMSTLDALLDKELRLEAAAMSKSAAAAKSTGGAKTEETLGDMDAEDEDRLKKKVNTGAWGIAKDKADVQVSMERVQNFEEAFHKIQAATGITDIEDLVRTFIKNEDQNFSLFNYVNEQTNEIEKLEEQIQQLKEEEQKYAQESGDDVHQHKQILRELEMKLQSTENMVEKYESRCQDTQKTIESLKKGIQSMFTKVECDTESMLSDSTVTEANILQYLGLIEQRCNDILQQYAAIQQKERARQATSGEEEGEGPGATVGTQAVLNVLGAGPTTPMGQDLIHVNPPKLEDYSSEDASDDDDDEARPLTRDELKAKTLNRMYRKGNRASATKKGKK